jgi:nucleoside-diphosphate-sugar epimerase
MTAITTTLVVGATGATGKHVVLQLLQRKQHVKAVVRSKQRLLDSLDEIVPNVSKEFADSLEIQEASLLDLSDEDLMELTSQCDATVSCLGHNINFQGIFGHPRRLVTDATKRLCNAIEANQSKEKEPTKCKFILMGTVAVPNPNGEDDKRTFGERFVLFLLRYFLPPHRDNEMAVAYIHGKANNPNLEWVIVRPTELTDGSASKYEMFSKPIDPLFGGDRSVTRANVAQSMVDMILTNTLWEEWKFKMPTVYDLN